MEEATDIERALLSGFIRDRYLLGRAMEIGFKPELMPHNLGRTLSRTLVDLSGNSEMPLEPIAVGAMLKERGLMSPEMRRFIDAVVAAPEPDASQVIAYVDLLKARASRLRLVEVNKSITDYLENERQDGGDIVDFLGTLVP